MAHRPCSSPSHPPPSHPPPPCTLQPLPAPTPKTGRGGWRRRPSLLPAKGPTTTARRGGRGGAAGRPGVASPLNHPPSPSPPPARTWRAAPAAAAATRRGERGWNIAVASGGRAWSVEGEEEEGMGKDGELASSRWRAWEWRRKGTVDAHLWIRRGVAS